MVDEQLSEANRAILRQSRELRDLVASPGWKVFEEIVRQQIKTREHIISLPFHTLPAEFMGLDFLGKSGSMESVKGALIGLKLALELPHATITHASSIGKEAKTAERQAP